MVYGSGKYFGELRDGVPNGFGKAKYTEMTYEGEWKILVWKNCLRHGHGIEIFRSGSFFDGVFAHVVRSGYGILHYSNGSYKSGIWL